MATGENFRVRLANARAEAVRSGRVVLGMTVVERIVQGTSYFLLSAVLAGSRIFESSAPFALALVGGAGSGINAAAALAGASFGYLTLLGMVEGLRYVSAAILTFAVAFAFYDVKFYRLPWTMPLAAAVMNGCTGFIYLSQKGWRAQDVIWFVLEVFLTALATYGFRAALAPDKGTRSRDGWLGGALLVAASLVSMAGLNLFADVSLGRMLASTVVLACAWQGGAGFGAALGVGLGLALDLVVGRVLYAMAWCGRSGCRSGAGTAAGQCCGDLCSGQCCGSALAVEQRHGAGYPLRGLRGRCSFSADPGIFSAAAGGAAAPGGTERGRGPGGGICQAPAEGYIGGFSHSVRKSAQLLSKTAGQ